MYLKYILVYLFFTTVNTHTHTHSQCIFLYIGVVYKTCNATQKQINIIYKMESATKQNKADQCNFTLVNNRVHCKN